MENHVKKNENEDEVDNLYHFIKMMNDPHHQIRNFKTKENTIVEIVKNDQNNQLKKTKQKLLQSVFISSKNPIKTNTDQSIIKCGNGLLMSIDDYQNNASLEENGEKENG